MKSQIVRILSSGSPVIFKNKKITRLWGFENAKFVYVLRAEVGGRMFNIRHEPEAGECLKVLKYSLKWRTKKKKRTSTNKQEWSKGWIIWHNRTFLPFNPYLAVVPFRVLPCRFLCFASEKIVSLSHTMIEGFVKAQWRSRITVNYSERITRIFVVNIYVKVISNSTNFSYSYSIPFLPQI